MMTRAGKISILALFIASLAATTIHAQLREGDPLRFSLKVGTEYTDNRDSAADGESNTDIWTKPRLDAIVDWGRGILDFYYEPAFRYRENPNDLQNYTELHHDVAVVLGHDIHPRLKLDVSERFARTDDPSIQRGGTTLRRDSSYIMNWTSLGAMFKIRPRTALTVSGTHNLKRYDESKVAIESDEDRATAGVTLKHYAAPTLALSVSASAAEVDYEHGDNIDRDYTGSSGGMAVEKIFGKNVRGSARAGYSALDYDSDDVESDSSPYFGIDVKVEPMPSRRFVAGATYELRESYAYPHASQEYRDMNARVELDFFARLTLKVGVAYQIGDYELETVTDEAAAKVMANWTSYPDWVQHFLVEGHTSGQEKTMVTSLELVYRIDDNASLALVQRYEDVDSDVGTTFDRNAVGLVLTKGF